MVSTRQMSNVGGSGGSSDGTALSNAEPGYYRVTRHSGALPPGGSSPQSSAPPVTTVSKCTSIVLPPPKVYTTSLLDLPVEIIEKIFRQLSFKSVAHLRMVSQKMNQICSLILNTTFQRLQTQMLHRFQSIKSKMPRRESARRSHPLACESDIIETLHMRLALLKMTFGKHIERKHCCFFPGEILDEVYSILHYLKTTIKLARPYKVTDELFDLTTMAMEYFKEHIEPNLPEIVYFGTDFFDITNTFSPGESSKSYMCMDSPPRRGYAGSPPPGASAQGKGDAPQYLLDESLPPSPPPPQSNMVLRKRIHRIKQGMKKYNDQLSALRSDLRSCKRKTALQQKQIAEQQKQLADQQKQTLEYANRLDDYDKKNEETSRKFQTLLQELNKCKTELQYWRSRSPAVPPVCAECGVPVAPSNAPAHLDAEWNIDVDITPAPAEPVEIPVAPVEAAIEIPAEAQLPVEATVSLAPTDARPDDLKKTPIVTFSEEAHSSKSKGGHSSDEGTDCSKRRMSSDCVGSTPERKKRRLNRSTRPRKQ